MRRLIPLLAASLLAALPAAGAEPLPTCHGLGATIVATGAGPVVGTPGDDVIVGTAAADLIDAGPGNDTICSGEGDDRIDGGDGDDWIDAGPGDDVVLAGRGRDRVRGGTGDDDLQGQVGKDRLRGGPGTDSARGGHGPDTCWGSEARTSCLRGLVLTLVADLGTDRVGVAASPPGDDRLFVVGQNGPIWQVGPAGVEPTPLIDLTDRVAHSNEQGVLGLAFHPDFSTNGRFFVLSTQPDNDVVIEEFVDDGAWPIDPTTAVEIISIHHPTTWHNGGMLQFGADGYLYASIGGGDAQDTSNLLGSIIRLDVDSASPYAIPADNPFVGGDGADAIWAFGLRNPWRFSIDLPGGRMYIADVGEHTYEEVDVADAGEAGNNYGWDRYEGDHCFDEDECDPDGLSFPVIEVAHGDAGACSIIGGFVYHGSQMPELSGRYVYGDFCGGWIRSFRYRGGMAIDDEQWIDTALKFTSFGTDSADELYVGTLSGELYRLDPAR